MTVALESFPRWHAWILLTRRTGLRLREQIALQSSDVHWHASIQITVDTYGI